MKISRLTAVVLTVMLTSALVSCGEEKIEWNERMVHEALKSANPAYTGGAQMQIMGGEVIALGLEDTGVTDLSPLTRMSTLGQRTRMARTT